MEEKIVLDFKNGLNISYLCEKYHKARKTIRKILVLNGLLNSVEPNRENFFNSKKNKEIGNILLDRYKSEKNLLKLTDEFNIPYTSILNFLKKNKVFEPKLYETRRKYELNENYFDNIDSEDKAYFLGILYADGTNSLKNYEVSLRLQETDLNILMKLNSLIQPTKPIGFIKSKNINWQNQYRLLINSKKISKRLSELGVTPNKTFITTYPLFLDNKFNKHFIRGYFDGDGSVFFNKINKNLGICITGTENLIISIQNILIKTENFNKTKLSNRYPERNTNTRSLNYFGNNNAKNFYDYIYENATIFMERKKNKFEKYLKIN